MPQQFDPLPATTSRATGRCQTCGYVVRAVEGLAVLHANIDRWPLTCGGVGLLVLPATVTNVAPLRGGA